MARPISIRLSLLRSLILVILLLSAAILATTVYASRRSVDTLSDALIRMTIDQTELRLGEFFEPVHRGLHVAAQWGGQGMLDVDQDPRELDRLFVPMLQQFPQISSVIVADSRGHEYMLLRTDDGWFNRQTRPDEWGQRTRWRIWSTPGEEPAVEWRELDYDPRTRPWYTGAVQQRRAGDAEAPAAKAPIDEIGSTERQVHWTQPYRFFTTQDPGITASLAFDAGDELEHVVAFDMLLSAIADYTTSMKVSTNGGLMVLTDDGRMVGPPRLARYDDSDARKADLLKRPEDLDWPLARQAARAFAEQESGDAGIVRFRSEGTRWWGEVRPFALTQDRLLYIAVLVPESDLLGSILTMRVWIIGITVIVLIGAMVYAFRLARRYSRPIEALVEQSDRISRGELDDDDAVESSVAEVNQLARAHDRMRDGLRSLMKLEGDLQLARRIQQNTFPSTLPTIRGFEIAAWSQPAEQTGGDSYDVIGIRANECAVELCSDDADSVIMLLADATGHGIGPALSATQIRAMLRMAVRMGGNLAGIARQMNEQLTADLPESRFITAWLGRIDAEAGTLTSFSAGQGPILHFHAQRGDIERLDADAPPFGINAEITYVIAEPVALRSGDVLAVLSDGIYEATDRAGAQFGLRNVNRVIAEHRVKSAQQILGGLRDALAVHLDSLSPADDCTAIVIKKT